MKPELTSVTSPEFAVVLLKPLRELVYCSAEDCEEPARLTITCADLAQNDSPYCAGHAHVMFADWMVGV